MLVTVLSVTGCVSSVVVCESVVVWLSVVVSGVAVVVSVTGIVSAEDTEEVSEEVSAGVEGVIEGTSDSAETCSTAVCSDEVGREEVSDEIWEEEGACPPELCSDKVGWVEVVEEAVTNSTLPVNRKDGEEEAWSSEDCSDIVGIEEVACPPELCEVSNEVLGEEEAEDREEASDEVATTDGVDFETPPDTAERLACFSNPESSVLVRQMSSRQSFLIETSSVDTSLNETASSPTSIPKILRNASMGFHDVTCCGVLVPTNIFNLSTLFSTPSTLLPSP